ncbi:predicted protein, partial [Arabidopsis lyrata subsp. lyrata]
VKAEAIGGDLSTSVSSSRRDPHIHRSASLEDLWKVVSPVEIEWEEVDIFYKCNWQFKSLEKALEGGMLYGKKVFVFVTPER